MTTLSGRLPHLYENLRTLRGKISGGSRPVPKGALAYAGQEIRFDRWPDPRAPFVQLEEADRAETAVSEARRHLPSVDQRERRSG